MTPENRSLGFPKRSDTNQAVQPQKIARGLKFRIYEVNGLYYLCSENKGANQLHGFLMTGLILTDVSATLAGGTNMGNIALWKYSPPLGKKKVDGEQKWKLQTPATVEGPVRQVTWGSNKDLLAVNTIANVFMLNEHVMSSSFRDQVSSCKPLCKKTCH